MLAGALALLPAVAQERREIRLDFNADMIDSRDGRVDYTLVAVNPGYIWRPSWNSIKFGDLEGGGGRWVFTRLRVPLRSQTYTWHAPMATFTLRTPGRQEVLNAPYLNPRVTETELAALDQDDGLFRPADRSLYPITFGERSNFVGLGPTITADSAYSRVGTLILDADLPENPGRDWVVKVVNAVGVERFYRPQDRLPAGPWRFTIGNVEAGNCLVELFAIDPMGSLGPHRRQVPVLVRKDGPGTASIRFVTDLNEPYHFIHSLALGQNSQTAWDQGQLPLKAGREAMIRGMAYEAFGSRPQNLRMEFGARLPDGRTWSHSVTEEVSYRVPGFAWGHYNAVPVLPAAFVQPGLELEARLVDPVSGALKDRRVLCPEVQAPRRIVLHAYQVKPYDWASGVPAVRNGEIRDQCLPYAEECFPYTRIEFRYHGTLLLPPFTGYGSNYLDLIAGYLSYRNGGSTDPNRPVEHLFMGVTNTKYGSQSVAGKAYYNRRGLALSYRVPTEPMGYVIAHEIGHNFGLLHAPSPGADQGPGNKIEAGYPYGGSGLAGGWGYSTLGRWFLPETGAASSYWSRAHWDTMSYANPQRSWGTRFSDIHADRLRPRFGPYLSAAAPSEPLPEALGMEPCPDGTWIFGEEAARRAAQAFAAETGRPLSDFPVIDLLQSSSDSQASSALRDYVTRKRSGGETLLMADPGEGGEIPTEEEGPVIVVTHFPDITRLADRIAQ